MCVSAASMLIRLSELKDVTDFAVFHDLQIQHASIEQN
jgi:hypothetical protein